MKFLKLSLIISIGLLSSFPLAGFAASGIGLSPAKMEVSLEPGQQVGKEITVINSTDRSLVFNVEIQDFIGGDSPTSPTKIITDKSSPYSLRDYLSISGNNLHFILPSGGKRSVPFTIKLPGDIAGGGYYAGILFSSTDLATSSIKVTTRLGALIFVRVPGQVSTRGETKEFGLRLDKDSSIPTFDILFENQGEMHLNPYGYISIRNWWGKEIDFINIKPWFVMPHSQRMISIASDKPFQSGWYRVTLKLNRGYEDTIDTLTTSVTIWTWWLIALVVVLVVIVWWLIHHYLWRRN